MEDLKVFVLCAQLIHRVEEGDLDPLAILYGAAGPN